MSKAVIVSAKRTAIGKVGGVLKEMHPQELAAVVIRQILKETRLEPTEIDEVILGNAIGPGGNIARLSGLEAGLPVSVPGMTVDRQCGSGLEAVIQAARLIQAGAGEVYIAGGVESTSLAPWKLEKPTSQVGFPTVLKRARFSPDAIGDPDMGMAAENVAIQYGISREQQDYFALNSHRKAIKSLDEGRFVAEIVPLNGITLDECPRRETSYEKLSQLQPVFKTMGTVTAGNACPINDGAAILLIMSEKKALKLGYTPILEFVDATSAGVNPNVLGIGPVPAVRKLLRRQSLSVSNLNLIEFNEAFAAQVLACLKELEIDEEVVNIGGGALAIGHPYGASGAILVTRLFSEMIKGNGKLGLATMGIGGGIGLAALFKRYEWRK
ncbi:thiolase family protein [Bacillus solitudinis]|uniref:thiolase family protein n=1 Tax=Bacillus solitudinis TaxID=2014074 RepID=UPI000C2501C0|nr:thiolase family protein [Bacillus solitudinis]